MADMTRTKKPVEQIDPKGEEVKEDINASLEKLASEQKPAPEMEISMDDPTAYVGLRFEIAKYYDEIEPEYTHVYQDASLSPSDLKSKRMEVVMKDGEPVRHGGDVLCRYPRERFDAARKRESEMSFERIRPLIRPGMEHEFKKTPSPKKPAG